MTDDTTPTSDQTPQQPLETPADATATRPSRPWDGLNRRWRALGVGRGATIAIATVALLAIGGVSVLASRHRPPSVMPVPPSAIASIVPADAVAAKGKVAELFGNKFILQDDSGRMLVDTGRDGETRVIVKAGDTVTAQGRFDRGFLHAVAITQADGRRVILGPHGGPPPHDMGRLIEKAGWGPQADVTALTALVEAKGFTEVRVTGEGPRHLEVTARAKDGTEHRLHVGFDGEIREPGDF